MKTTYKQLTHNTLAHNVTELYLWIRDFKYNLETYYSVDIPTSKDVSFEPTIQYKAPEYGERDTRTIPEIEWLELASLL